MNSERFYELLENQISHIRETMVRKGEEYSTDDNKLRNFDLAARVEGTSREKALNGMALKHYVSVMDIRDRIAKDPNDLPSIETVNEKFGDLINYCILEKACIVDRIEKAEADKVKNT